MAKRMDIVMNYFQNIMIIDIFYISIIFHIRNNIQLYSIMFHYG